MNATEIIERDVKGDGIFQVRQRLAERISKAREATKVHPHAQVCPFDVRRGNASEVRLADFDMWNCSKNMATAVPAVASSTTVDFAKLSEVHVLPKVLTHRAHIGIVLVAGHLVATICARAKVGHEGMSVDTVSRANVVRDDELAFAVQGEPQHCAAPLIGVAFVQVRLTRVDISPHLIHLHESRADVADSGIEKLSRSLRCRVHQSQNRVLVKSGQPRDRADAHALKHHGKGFRGNVRRGVVCAQLGSRLRESDFAGNATIPLNAALSVGSKSADYVVTALAGHIGLVFLAEQADNDFASALRLTPRAEQPRFSVRAESGADFREGHGGDRTLNLPISNRLLSPVELRAHKRGIRRFAPSNALRLLTRHWWISHGCSPFSWIEHLKSFLIFGRYSGFRSSDDNCNLFCDVLLPLLSCYTGHSRKFGKVRKARNGGLFFPAVDVAESSVSKKFDLATILHALECSSYRSHLIRELIEVETNPTQLISDFSGLQSGVRIHLPMALKHRSNSIRKTQIAYRRHFSAKCRESSNRMQQLGLALRKLFFAPVNVAQLAPSLVERRSKFIVFRTILSHRGMVHGR